MVPWWPGKELVWPFQLLLLSFCSIMDSLHKDSSQLNHANISLHKGWWSSSAWWGHRTASEQQWCCEVRILACSDSVLIILVTCFILTEWQLLSHQCVSVTVHVSQFVKLDYHVEFISPKIINNDKIMIIVNNGPRKYCDMELCQKINRSRS